MNILFLHTILSKLINFIIKNSCPFFFQILLEFQSREGCSPRAETRDGDMKLLTSLRDSIISKFGLPEKKIPEEILPMLFSELSPVAAIVGGVLGQEVIKVISNKDAPHNNFFLYNPLESSGIIETIGYWFLCFFFVNAKPVRICINITNKV